MMKKHLNAIVSTANKGFTLVEILVALTLLGLLGTFVGGKIMEQLHQGNVQAAKIQMNQLKARLQEFRRVCYFYPTEEQGLQALTEKPTQGRECPRYPSGGFIEDDVIPPDPWDNPYEYLGGGNDYNIVSRGADRLEGGVDNDADIFLNEPKNFEEASE